MLRAVASVTLSAVLAGACASAPSTSPSPLATPSPLSSLPTPSPAPSSSPSPIPTAVPTATLTAAEWPVAGVSGTIVGPDGTAYAWLTGPGGTPAVTALDANGAVRPGWPFRSGSSGVDQALVLAGDGSLLIGFHDEGETGFVLHRVGADGRELAGWPFRDDTARYCPPPASGPGGSVVLGCIRADGVSATIVVIDAAGRVVPGWPVKLDGIESFGESWGAEIQLGSDGTVFALGIPAEPAKKARLWAFAADGGRRPGFPVTLGAHQAAYLIAPADRVLVGSYVPPATPEGGLCSEARETVLTELDGVGRVAAGWPVTAAGWASRPVIGTDGTVYYLTSTRIFARAPNGSARPGWPIAIPPVYPQCAEYGPYLGTDGTVYVMADGLRAFGPDGRARPGWPFEPADGFAGRFCETDSAGATSPAFGRDGLTYAAVQGPGGTPEKPGPLQVVALDPTGRVVSGWPYALPAGPAQVEQLVVIQGRLYVDLRRCDSPDSNLLLALDADGTPAH